MNIAVIGSGGWGTALAKLLCTNGHDVILWSYLESECETLKQTGENPFLKGVKLPEGLTYTTDISCVAGKDLVVMATPSFATRNTAKSVAPHLTEGTILVSVSKGIEKDTGCRLSEIIVQETGYPTVVLCGPSHAEEVAREVPTGCVSACSDLAAAQKVQDAFMNKVFRVYVSHDVVGVELGSALKNVIALCAGICDGMGFGDNTKALLMTRGLTEWARLTMAMGGHQETVAGLAGVGDLIVTCTSMHSRNRRAGILMGQGKSPKEAMDEVGAVVEGYYAAKTAYELGQKMQVEMPITEQAYAILYEGKNAREVLQNLMTREKRHEFEDAGWNVGV